MNKSSGDVTIKLNAASEMLGVKKARRDFNVTGDLDGMKPGIGEGYPGIQTGIAPGAALVGVKVLDHNGDGTFANLQQGLDCFGLLFSTLVYLPDMSHSTHGIPVKSSSKSSQTAVTTMSL